MWFNRVRLRDFPSCLLKYLVGFFRVQKSTGPTSALQVPSCLPPLPPRFPFSRPELLKEWVLNIGRGNFKPKQHTVICSEHFRPECFSAFGNRKNLKQNAVPTVFAFQDAAQLVRENTDPAGGGADADPEKEEVVSEAGPAECGLGRKTDAALEALPPHAGGPVEQVRCGARVRRQRVVAQAPHGGGGSLQTEGSNLVPKWEPHSPWPRSRTLRVERAGGDVRGAVASRAGPGRVPARHGHGPGSQPWAPPRLHALCPQVSPQRPQGSRAPGQPASPAQPSDHSYALLDLDALKKKLFLTLKENEKLRKRLKAQRLVIQRMSSRLRAHRAGQPGLQARPPPEQQS
ncbi:THAP domain-containing protein 3 isoform X1 [Lynx canadensis]|uniref:THAP domain-containing protein 3 isoform X1 n=1 Tax=Lynx canadensis TaxID=61383 RepID=UPI0011B0B043|nr:THAP domain-containing protein 3 isoform X1 [Lynx canadensis]